MADPKEQNPAVKESPPTQRPGLEPQVRKVAMFLSIAGVIFGLSAWVMMLSKRLGGILALLGGALAFAALLHVARRTNGGDLR